MPTAALASSSLALAGLVFVGSGLGGVLRFGVGMAMRQAGIGFPFATLMVNVLGSFAAGMLAGVVAAGREGGPTGWLAGEPARALLMVGVLGGFTTFSAFTRETHELLANGLAGRAMLNIGLSLALGLVACVLGVWAGASLSR